MRWTGGVRQGGEQAPGWPLRGGHLQQHDARGVPDDVPAGREVSCHLISQFQSHLTNYMHTHTRYFCRSVEFDDQSKQCILSEEDSISQKDDISISSSPTHHFYDLVCLDNRKWLP